MTIKLTIEVEGPITEEDKLVLSNATMALLAIANSALTEEDAAEEDPPPPPAPAKTTGKEVN